MSTPEFNASIVSIDSKEGDPGTTILTLSTGSKFEFGGVTYDPELKVDENGDLLFRAMLRIDPRPDKLINLEVGPLITKDQQFILEARSNIHPLFVLQSPPTVTNPVPLKINVPLKITVHPKSAVQQEAEISKHINALAEAINFLKNLFHF